jgi:flagellar protein FliL
MADAKEKPAAKGEAEKPAEGEAEAPKKSKLKLILIIVVVVLLLAGLGVGAGVMFLGLRIPFISPPPPPAEGEEHAGEGGEHGEHGKPAEKGKEKEKEGKGGKGEAERPRPIFVAVPPVVVNLADKNARRFIRLGVSIEVGSSSGEQLVKENVPRIIDAFQVFLRAQSLDSFNSAGALLELRRELLARVNRIDPSIDARAVLLQDLIIQ